MISFRYNVELYFRLSIFFYCLSSHLFNNYSGDYVRMEIKSYFIIFARFSYFFQNCYAILLVVAFLLQCLRYKI